MLSNHTHLYRERICIEGTRDRVLSKVLNLGGGGAIIDNTVVGVDMGERYASSCTKCENKGINFET